MNILFICGCMEPGKDGVGDYTRRLAGEMQKKEQNIFIVALYDKYVNEAKLEIQISDDFEMNVLRLPRKPSFQNVKSNVDPYLTIFDPDWISLQFVPYAFHPRGIPWVLPNILISLFPDQRWHIMFHETYVSGAAGLKEKFVKALQIKMLNKLVKKLNPGLIHTSTEIYQELLKKIGIDSHLLGLFGNIPVNGRKNNDKQNMHLKGIYFGASPKGQNFEIVASKISNFLKQSDVKVELIFCGKANADRKKFISFLTMKCNSTQLSIQDIGEMESADLSQLFLDSDFGMARVGTKLLGKSGAALAMLEHGLPLFIPLALSGEIQRYNGYRADQCYDDLQDLVSTQKDFSMGSRLPEIMSSLLSELEACLVSKSSKF